jgi:hypothetical protein
MRKIEAIENILGTKKVAYNNEQGQAIFCKGRNFVYSAKTMGCDETKECLTVNEYVNNSLTDEVWEVTEEEYDTLSDFEFFEESIEITINQAFELLSRNVRVISAKCKYNPIQFELVGVKIEGSPFIIKFADDKSQKTFSDQTFKVRKSLLIENGLI